MAGFKPRSSGVGSKRSSRCAQQLPYKTFSLQLPKELSPGLTVKDGDSSNVLNEVLP